MKMIVIIVVLVLLIGGGAGGYYFMRSSAPPPPVAAPMPPDPVYLKLDTFVVPVLRGGVIDGFVRLEVTLELRDAEAKREFDRRMAKLRDAILTDLHALIPLRRAGASERLSSTDVAAIKGRLMKIVESQVGAGVVRDVLLEEAHEIPGGPQFKPKG